MHQSCYTMPTIPTGSERRGFEKKIGCNSRCACYRINTDSGSSGCDSGELLHRLHAVSVCSGSGDGVAHPECVLDHVGKAHYRCGAHALLLNTIMNVRKAPSGAFCYYEAMDVVYTVRHGDRNDELRYSLRSLQNLPHDNVWFVGYTPRWAKVNSIVTNQVATSYVNVLRNLQAVAENDDISENFYFFNDDFFVMKAMTSVPDFHRGDLTGHIRRQYRTFGENNGYGKMMEVTKAILNEWDIGEPLSYTCHCPVMLNKSNIRILAQRLQDTEYPGAGLLLRTLYGNLFQVGGIEVFDFKVTGAGIDIYQKVMARHDNDPPFLSTDDQSFWYGHVGAVIRVKFKKPSPYEDQQKAERIMRIRRETRPSIR